MSLNVLIIMPRMTTSSCEWYMFPLGIAYISSALKQYGKHRVFTLNLNSSDDSIEYVIKEAIFRDKIDVVATGGLSQQYCDIYNICSVAKKISNDIITIVGGGYITSDPEVAMLAMPEIDIGVIGEGEVTFCHLIDVLEAKKQLINVAGIIFKDKDSFIVTEAREEIKYIDKLPFPDYAGFDYENYLKLVPLFFSFYESGAAVLLTTRSCPYRCTFCFHPVGNTYRKRSLDNVFDELDLLVAQYSITSLYILDELFGADAIRIQDFCVRIKSYKLSWWVQMRVDFAKFEILQLMKDAGCKMVTYGIDSADNSILKSMRKNITVDQKNDALESAKLVGMGVVGNLLFGDAAETVHTAENSIQWWLNHKDFNISMIMLITFPGTCLYKHAIQSNYFKNIDDRVKFLKDGCPTINISRMTDDEYLDLSVRIAEVVCSNGNPIRNVTFSNVNWDQLTLDIFGFCYYCGFKNFWNDIYIASENRHLGCSKCGTLHGNNFSQQFFCNFFENLSHLCKTNKNVLIWGQGRIITSFLKSNMDAQNLNFIFADKALPKQGKLFYSRLIQSPEIVKDIDFDSIIIATSEMKYHEVKNELSSYYAQSNRQFAKVFILGELMNPNFKSKIL